MAPRFYLDLIDGSEVIRDTGGMEARDLDHATDHAQSVLQEIRKAGRLTGSAGPWAIVIRDRTGRSIRRIALS